MTDVTAASLRAAHSDDFERVSKLLVDNALPLDGVPKSLTGFVVVEEGDRIIGVAGVEDCGEYGLLRSAAVAEDARNRGLGRRLIEQLIADAKAGNRRGLYLLTTTAAKYFPSFGFVETSRDNVPASVRETKEFSEACPASATVMKVDFD